MSVLKHFDCLQCGSEGKITIKGNEVVLSDVVYCPICGADIYEPEDFDDDDE